MKVASATTACPVAAVAQRVNPARHPAQRIIGVGGDPAQLIGAGGDVAVTVVGEGGNVPQGIDLLLQAPRAVVDEAGHTAQGILDRYREFEGSLSGGRASDGAGCGIQTQARRQGSAADGKSQRARAAARGNLLVVARDKDRPV